jgi:hypothetical protein
MMRWRSVRRRSARAPPAAHPVKVVSLDDQFAIIMPYAESSSPITRGNWEGTGVVPDVPTTAEAAFDEAVKRAAAATKR